MTDESRRLAPDLRVPQRNRWHPRRWPIDIVENRFVGMKSRGCYETPGGTVLYAAHLDLETLTVDREVMRLRDQLSVRYAELIYNGMWFSPEMEFLDAAMDNAQKFVTGSVDLRLHKGNVINRGEAVLCRCTTKILFPWTSKGFHPEMSTSFIHTLSTRLKASAAREKIARGEGSAKGTSMNEVLDAVA